MRIRRRLVSPIFGVKEPKRLMPQQERKHLNHPVQNCKFFHNRLNYYCEIATRTYPKFTRFCDLLPIGSRLRRNARSKCKDYCVVVNIEIISSKTFRDIKNKKAHQLAGQCETRRHSSHSDCRRYYLPSLVPKTFMHDHALTRSGEVTATKTRHQSFM